MGAPHHTFDDLVAIMARLRAPDGCPWDREQDFASLRAYVIEEAYEVVAAIDAGDRRELAEELGDLLLQVVFLAQLGAEEGSFAIGDVVEAICTKLIRRHPHVFGDEAVADTEELLRNWERIKEEERAAKGEAAAKGRFDGIPQALPALMRALQISERVVRLGFDWPDLEGVVEKVAEEVREIAACDSQEARELEFGDLLFTVVNAGRHLGIDAEQALRRANDKFVERFTRLERRAAEEGVALTELTPEAWEARWRAAKEAEG
ncbi:MAG: nucleoside triphosphate pyrophosphohydrolase [Nitrospirae bacterium]|nr:MAG: nucleoside triphosphate pyrophosphohydrolase [Nitrospirota bacterium]